MKPQTYAKNMTMIQITQKIKSYQKNVKLTCAGFIYQFQIFRPMQRAFFNQFTCVTQVHTIYSQKNSHFIFCELYPYQSILDGVGYLYIV